MNVRTTDRAAAGGLPERMVISAIMAWIITNIVTGSVLHAYSLEFFATQSFGIFAAVLLVSFGVIFALAGRFARISRVALPVLVVLFSILATIREGEIWMSVGFGALSALSFWYVREDVFSYLNRINITDKAVKYLFILMGIFLFVFIGGTVLLRYLTYNAPDADTALFSQMFEYMRTTGRMDTTVERNELMSHFEIHVSPIFYLLLPLFMLFPDPATLQFAQGFLVALGLLPLYLLCREYRLSRKMTLVMGFFYTFYPGITGSSMNDFHENCFLPVLLLFFIYAFKKKNGILLAVFAVLLLMVKEDTAIHMVILSVFWMIAEPDPADKRRAGAVLAGSLLYFGAAVFFLHQFGRGVLGYMMNLQTTPESGTSEIIKAIIMNPGYAIRECFNQPEKLAYLALMTVPFNIALLSPKKISRYLLFASFLLLNLMPDYTPMHQIEYQYHFVPSVFFLYLILMNTSDWKPDRRRSWSVIAILFITVLFATTIFRLPVKYGKELLGNRTEINALNAAVTSIPADASVSASTYLAAHLWQHRELYEVNARQADYLVLDLRPDFSRKTAEELTEEFGEKGYEQIRLEEDIVMIMKKK